MPPRRNLPREVLCYGGSRLWRETQWGRVGRTTLPFSSPGSWCPSLLSLRQSRLIRSVKVNWPLLWLHPTRRILYYSKGNDLHMFRPAHRWTVLQDLPHGRHGFWNGSRWVSRGRWRIWEPRKLKWRHRTSTEEVTIVFRLLSGRDWSYKIYYLLMVLSVTPPYVLGELGGDLLPHCCTRPFSVTLSSIRTPMFREV